MLPDISGEIDAAADQGMGVRRLGLKAFTVELDGDVAFTVEVDLPRASTQRRPRGAAEA